MVEFFLLLYTYIVIHITYTTKNILLLFVSIMWNKIIVPRIWLTQPSKFVRCVFFVFHFIISCASPTTHQRYFVRLCCLCLKKDYNFFIWTFIWTFRTIYQLLIVIDFKFVFLQKKSFFKPQNYRDWLTTFNETEKRELPNAMKMI